MKEQFEVGDKVRAWGIDGVVIEVGDHGDNSVKILIEDGRRASFTTAGMHLDWHKEPSLFLVEKAKKEDAEAAKKALEDAGATVELA